jgi:hypothetical protein
MILAKTDEELFIDSEIERRLVERRIRGRQEYGHGLAYEETEGQSWLNHALDEAIDLLQYLLVMKYGEEHGKEDAENER